MLMVSARISMTHTMLASDISSPSATRFSLGAAINCVAMRCNPMLNRNDMTAASGDGAHRPPRARPTLTVARLQPALGRIAARRG